MTPMRRLMGTRVTELSPVLLFGLLCVLGNRITDYIQHLFTQSPSPSTQYLHPFHLP